MNTQTTATNFNTITYEVISFSTHLLWMSLQQRNIIWIRHREWMMCSHKPIFFITPFKEREVNYPQTLKYIFISQAKTLSHFKAQRTKLYTNFISSAAPKSLFITTQNEYQIAFLCAHFLYDFLQLLRRIEFINTTLYRTVVFYLYIYKTFCTDLRFLYEIS